MLLPTFCEAQPVTGTAGGAFHTLFLKSNGSLWGMGTNSDGQLGDGSTNNVNRPEQIVASNVIAVAAGYHHTPFVTSDGSLWGMGNNACGQLGDGITINILRPKQIVAVPPGYNRISAELLDTGDMRLSFVGMVGASYALERSYTLMPVNWIPQLTNFAEAEGRLSFTNRPAMTTNNFWRIRSVL